MLQSITLHLARSPEFPEGSAVCGYDLVAPLNASGHLDAEEWRKRKARCLVRRFWTGQNDRHGALLHQAGGAKGARWKIEYFDGDSEETGVRLDTHRFAESEYIFIRDDDGHDQTFKISCVRPIEASE